MDKLQGTLLGVLELSSAPKIGHLLLNPAFVVAYHCPLSIQIDGSPTEISGLWQILGLFVVTGSSLNVSRC